MAAPLRRTEVFIHHTTVIDGDQSANTWDSLAAVRAQMRRLQTLRTADLGADVPYNHVAFCMRDGELVLCEGRGLERTGAHTPNHNRSALGIAIQGNSIDGKPGRNTHTAVLAYERRLDLDPRGVMGSLNDPIAGIWPTTREMLLAMTAAVSSG